MPVVMPFKFFDVNKILKPILPWQQLAQTLIEELEISKTIVKSGWLPHATTPEIERHEKHPDNIQMIDEKLTKHYTFYWSEVRQKLSDLVRAHDVDSEAKAAFEEALKCHEAGFYRAVPRLLFPEIERVVRVEWYDGNVAESIASLHRLQDEAENVFADIAAGGGFATVELWQRLEAHVYARIKNNDERDAILGNPIPNRHACIHGAVIYSTMKSSINALLIAEFAFQVVSEERQRRAEDRPPP